jgi:hypothetical protein
MKWLWTLNAWIDELLIELSYPLLCIAFIMATADFLQNGSMATNGLFKGLWSWTQAMAIDGSTIGIWSRILRKKQYKLLPVGLLMLIVVAMVNDIVTYQQLHNVATALGAMHDLHIDIALFSSLRSLLIAIVLIALIPLRGEEATEKATIDSPIALRVREKRLRPKATVIEEKAAPVAIPEKSEAMELSKKELCIAAWEESDKGRGVKKAIATELQIGYSTVKKYLDEV